MNGLMRQMNALIMCAMVVTVVPAYSMENEVEVVEQETTVRLYQQRSVQIAAAAIATAAAVYGFAVYNGKVASPAALYTGLFCTQIVQAIATENNNSDVQDSANGTEVIVVVENTTNENQHVDVITEDSSTDATQENVVVDVVENNQDQDASHSVKTPDMIVKHYVAQAGAKADIVIGKAKFFGAEFKKAVQEWANSDSDSTP